VQDLQYAFCSQLSQCAVEQEVALAAIMIAFLYIFTPADAKV